MAQTAWKRIGKPFSMQVGTGGNEMLYLCSVKGKSLSADLLACGQSHNSHEKNA